VFLQLQAKGWAKSFQNWFELHWTPAFLGCLHPFRMAGHGEFTRRSKRQREPSTPDSQLRNKRHYGNDSVEAGWDHHFADSSMQGMITTWFLPKGDIMSYLLWVDIVLNQWSYAHSISLVQTTAGLMQSVPSQAAPYPWTWISTRCLPQNWSMCL